MSFLGERIQTAVRGIVQKLDNPGDRKAIFDEFCKALVGRYDELRQAGTLVVNDRRIGGLFLSSGRDYVVRSQAGSLIKAVGCSDDTRRLEHEPAFSRALFNQKVIALDHSECAFLAYEAPLLRSPGSTDASCDLVAVQPRRLLAIECKKNLQEQNRMPAALLESFAYGLLIAKHASDAWAAVRAQISTCLQVFHGKPPDSISEFFPEDNAQHASKPEGLEVVHYVAAPLAYYRASLPEAHRRPKSRTAREDWERTVRYLEQAFQGYDLSPKPAFGGYLVVEPAIRYTRSTKTKQPDFWIPTFGVGLSRHKSMADVRRAVAWNS